MLKTATFTALAGLATLAWLGGCSKATEAESNTLMRGDAGAGAGDDSGSADDGSADDGATDGSGGGSSSGNGGSSSSASVNATTGLVDLSSSTGGGAPPTIGEEDDCDGIDNDGNGVIDDVDVGADGVCDCLRIATLGLTGVWGEGDIFDTWLNERSDNGAVALDDATLTPELLSQFQVVVAQDLSQLGRSYSDDEVAALSDWVRAGGGFMTLIGYTTTVELANVNLLLAPFGLSYETQPIFQGNQNTVPITNWLAHPVTEGVSELGINNGFPVAGGDVIATEQSIDVLSAREVDAGHVLAWGDEWITYNSEWEEHPEYQVELFWVNAVKWLTPINECQVPIPEIIK